MVDDRREDGAMVWLGVDIGKSDFHCALLISGAPVKRHSFPNSELGFTQLGRWLANRRVSHVHACLEATGGWSEDLAVFLHEHGHTVSVVNPLVIKAFGQSTLTRTKTDKADAELIARFCSTMQPEPWRAPSAAQRRLQQLTRRRSALSDMLVQEKNRLQGPAIEAIRSSLERTATFLERQIAEIDEEIRSFIDTDPTLREQRELLESIPGIGERTSTTILGEMPNIAEYRSGKAVAAFAGLCPRERRSGTSVSSSWLSKVGNHIIRRALYLPAIAALRYNPVLKVWAGELRARGKRGKQIIAAVMRRLLVIAYGVLKSRRPFEIRATA
jgi:transposase